MLVVTHFGNTLPFCFWSAGSGNHASMSDKCMLSILNILDKSFVMFIAFFCLHKSLNIPGCNLVPAFWHIFVKILNPVQPGKSLISLPGKPSSGLLGFCLYFTKSNSIELGHNCSFHFTLAVSSPSVTCILWCQVKRKRDWQTKLSKAIYSKNIINPLF